MNKYLISVTLSLASMATAFAQTPANNWMPDGSRDMYIGIGAMSKPLYEGADKSRTLAVPVLQMQWSNGLFVAGLGAGLHLSKTPEHEFGPLIMYEPSRASKVNAIFPQSLSSSNLADSADLTSSASDGFFTSSSISSITVNPVNTVNTVGSAADVSTSFPNTILPGTDIITTPVGDLKISADARTGSQIVTGSANCLGTCENLGKNKQLGSENTKARVLVGGFYNTQLSHNLRMTNSLVYGAGDKHNGLRFNSDLRYRFQNMGNYHHVIIGVGTSIVNQAYNQAYFGITPSSINFSFSVKNTLNPEAPITTETARLGFRGYRATAGVKDLHADIFWRWNLSSSWLFASHLNITRLVGSAAESPLVDRRNNLTISSAIAYRF